MAAPPWWLPIGFMIASGAGMLLMSIVLWFASDQVVLAPTSQATVAAVHAAILGFLTMGVLGALHQFAPVMGNRPLRSTAAGAVTLGLFVIGVWMLVAGFAFGPRWLVMSGGTAATAAMVVAVWNLSGPLSGRNGQLAIVGLRASVAFFAVTVLFGITFAFARHFAWFPLLPIRVLTHAHLGLIGWLGLTYISVAERLWPMFLLSHRPTNRTGPIAIWSTVLGVLALSSGLLFSVKPLAIGGGVLVVIGAVAHLASFASVVKRRRRRFELLHAFTITAGAFLLIALGTGTAAGLADVGAASRARLVTIEIASLVAWIGLALVGHAYKVVPFIVWSHLKEVGRNTDASGKQLLFSDLYRRRWAHATFALTGAGFLLLLSAIALENSSVVRIAALFLFAGGATLTWNLATGPRMAHRQASGTPETR